MAKCVQCGRNMPGFSFGKKTCQWCVEYEAAKRGEASEDAVQRVMPVPWARGASQRPVTQAIFGINVAVFLGMAFAGVSVTDPTSADLLHWGANSARLTLTGEWWRLVTSMFLHIGIIHIALNMWCLWSLGVLAESLYGSWTFAAVYLISGISGSLVSAAWHPYGVSAGASGAIFGVAGALVASIKFGEFSLPRSLVAGQLSCLLSFVAYNLVFGAISGATDNACHLGGLAGGFIMGALIARVAPDRNAVVSRVAVLLIGIMSAVGAGLWLEHTRGNGALIARANQLMVENRAAEAISLLQGMTRRNPSSVPAHFSLAHAYFAAERYGEAEAELKQVLLLQPDYSDARYRLGVTYMNEKRFTDAKNVFSEGLARDPKNADSHYGLGLVFATQGDYESAAREFNETTRLSPEFADAYYEAGTSYLKLKKCDQAIDVFLRGVQQGGDDQYLESGLAEAYTVKGMKVEAAEAQRKAEQLKNEDSD